MTDGPLRNLRLGNGWTRLVEAVENDAASPTECVAFALDALARHLVTKTHAKALEEIETYLHRGELDLDPVGYLEAIFDRRETTPFLNALKKHLLYRVADGTPLRNAIKPALDAAIGSQIAEARNRFHEECIRAQEAGEMSGSAADRAHEKIDAAFDAVVSSRVRDALLAGRKDAFEKELGRSDSVDEGLVCL